MDQSDTPMFEEFLVEVSDPDLLDQTLNQLGAAVVRGGMPGGYQTEDGYYVVRCLGNAGFIKFAIESQGYGEVIRDR